MTATRTYKKVSLSHVRYNPEIVGDSIALENKIFPVKKICSAFVQYRKQQQMTRIGRRIDISLSISSKIKPVQHVKAGTVREERQPLEGVSSSRISTI